MGNLPRSYDRDMVEATQLEETQLEEPRVIMPGMFFITRQRLVYVRFGNGTFAQSPGLNSLLFDGHGSDSETEDFSATGTRKRLGEGR